MSLSRQLQTALGTVSKGIRYIESRRVSCGQEYAYRLPVGLSCHDIEKRTDVLTAAVGAPIELVDRGGAVIIRVVEKDFKIPLSFKAADLRPDMLLLGYNRQMKPVYHRPMHILAGGAAGSGKTVWLRLMLLGLVHMSADIKIADLKGFSFFPFESITGVSIARKLPDAADMLFEALTVLERRETAVIHSRDRSIINTFRPYAVVIDEAAQIAPSSYGRKSKLRDYAQFCDEAVARLAQKGRETKVFLLYCTQKPSADILNGQVKANVEAAAAFRTFTDYESRIIIGRDGAERISVTTPGRCIYRGTTFETLQVPFIGETDEEWEKILRPYKTEVLDSGHSERRPQRRYLDGSYSGASGHDQATGDVKQQFASAEKGVSGPPRLGEGTAGYVAVPRKGKAVAAHQKGTDDLRYVSDTID